MLTYVIQNDKVCDEVLQFLHHGMVEGVIRDAEVEFPRNVGRTGADVLPPRLEVLINGTNLVVVTIAGLNDD